LFIIIITHPRLCSVLGLAPGGFRLPGGDDVQNDELLTAEDFAPQGNSPAASGSPPGNRPLLLKPPGITLPTGKTGASKKEKKARARTPIMASSPSKIDAGAEALAEVRQSPFDPMAPSNTWETHLKVP